MFLYAYVVSGCLQVAKSIFLCHMALRSMAIIIITVITIQVPDYVVVIKSPMDLSTMMNKINLHHYNTGRDFLDDIDLICRNALEYNPDRDPGGMQGGSNPGHDT